MLEVMKPVCVPEASKESPELPQLLLSTLKP